MDDSLQALLARSRSPGDFVERRRFTLSREKAIEKQRAFALRDPRRYILELVQSAVHADASFIAVDVHYEHVLIAFVGGRSVGVGELSQLFDYLFADRGDPETRHLIQLAMGVNALLKLKPHSVRIESGLDEAAARMDIDGRGNVRVGEPQEPIAGTYVFARLRSSPFKRFSDVKVFPEQALIEERCIHTPVPILINGSAPFGYRIGRSVDAYPGAHQHTFDTDNRYGVLALPRLPGHAPGFKVVMGGTWITTLQLPELGEVRMRSAKGAWVRQPFFGVICDDNLRKTADQSDIVRDRRFSEMIRALRPMARALARRSGADADYLGAEDDDAVALPVRLPVLGQPTPLPARTLRELPADEPVFWVSPDETAPVAAVADPAVFEPRVLVLREVEAADLAELRPDLSLQRLSRASDVDYAQHLLQRSQRLHAVERTLEGGARLRLRLHLTGPLPGWGVGEGLPTLIEQGGVALSTLRLPLELPRVSTALTLPAGAEPPTPEALTRAALENAWRLLPGAPAAHPASATLGAWLVTHFGERLAPDGRLLLPPHWQQEAREALLSLPATQDGLPLGRALLEGVEGPWRPEFAALQGKPPTVELGLDPEALQRLLDTGQGAEGWLCALELQLPGLRGCLGLRDELPPRAGVLLWDGPERSRLRALGSLPVQGVLHGAPSAEALSQLELALPELYHRLLDVLGARPSPAALAQAQAYIAASPAPDALREALQRALKDLPDAPTPSLWDPQGLAEWLHAELVAALRELEVQGARLEVQVVEVTGLWRILPGAPVSAGVSGQALSLRLHLQHPAVEAALQGVEARRRLLLEAGRVALAQAEEVEMFHVEHSALQVALLARLLTPAREEAREDLRAEGPPLKRADKLGERKTKSRHELGYSSIKSRPD
ncbi:MAG: hypothetical protein H6740_14125 [Alphaproteobacteria bacterium]|nr:hypothetical protein [Alphaproteobacteria bacterium]